jgi:hypothetical protein
MWPFGDPVSNRTLSDLVAGTPGKAPDDSWLMKLHNSISPAANASTILSLMGRGSAGSAVRAGYGSTGGDVVNDPRLLDKINSHFSASPNQRVGQGFNMFGPQASQPAQAMLPTPPTPAPVQIADDDVKPTMPPGALSANASAPAAPPAAWAGPHSVGGQALYAGPPQPQAAPPEAWGPLGGPGSPQAQDLGPASQQASGTDVIQKLMSYFGNKANPNG